MRLSDAKAGDTLEVIGYSFGFSDCKQKLLALGLTRGVRITVLRKCWFNELMTISLRGYELAFRQDEVKNIKVRLIAD